MTRRCPGQDPAHLRTLGRTAVGELRYQGERKGWDAGRTDTVVRTGLSDLYAGAVEAAIGQDPERAATLYDHARDVILPERQAAVEARIERAREERRVTEIVGGLADTPDDPARRPDPDEYQARTAELTPPDASPEVRAQVTRMARIEQARADRAWQATRGRAATGALDWLGENPAAPLMAMPTELRDGLSPQQTEALDRTVMNGGRVVTDRDLYDRLDDQAVRDPESFVGVDLTQYRLSLGNSDYDRLTKLQKTLAEGKSDPAFERHRLGRLFLDEGVRAADVDPDGEDARTARQQLDRLLGAFEAVEGKPPTMADIRGLVGDVLPRGEGDPNIVQTSGGDLVEANGNTEIVEPQEPAKALRGIAPPTEPAPGSPEFQAAMAKTATSPNGEKIVILPNGKSVPSEDSKTGFLLSPIEDLSEVASAGRETGRKILKEPSKVRELVRKDLAQGGRFDYQRLLDSRRRSGLSTVAPISRCLEFQRGTVHATGQRTPSLGCGDCRGICTREFEQLHAERTLRPRSASHTVDRTRLCGGRKWRLQSATKKGQSSAKDGGLIGVYSPLLPKEPYGLNPQIKRWIERGYAAGAGSAFTLAAPGYPSGHR